MTRSASGIKSEARTIGQHAVQGSLPDNECIQVLSALVEELASHVQTLQQQIEELMRKQGRMS